MSNAITTQELDLIVNSVGRNCELDPLHAPVPAIMEEADKALFVLDDYGYAPKVFSMADGKRPAAPFGVESTRWSWIVKPLDKVAITTIPVEFIQALYILREYKIQISAIAITKPTPREAMGGVLKQELVNLLDSTMKPIAYTLSLLGVGAKNVWKGLKNIHAYLIENSDPVLLVRVDEKWIEIGRWE